MPANSLKVAVVSDLHFVDSTQVKDGSRQSWLSFTKENGLQGAFWQNLLDKIKADEITADILVCPGDITTYAETTALKFAWEKINELAKALNCSLLATATGNHDVNSRGLELNNVVRDLDKDHSLIEHLKQLSPVYPLVNINQPENLEDHMNRVHYFGSDFLFLQKDKYNLVILNSCANHTSDPAAHEKGFVSKSTHQWLEESLKRNFDRKNKKLGILVCHHHPIQHADHGIGTYDFMNGGTELLEMLNKYGNWVVIHGHKHHAKLSYHSDGSKKTVVFAAGTLSCHKETLGGDFTNQFYIMNVDTSKTKGTPQGTFEVYTWQGSHWALSKRRADGVFSGVGFGDVGCLEELAEEISKNVAPVKGTDWAQIIQSFPQIKCCVPKDLEHLENNLQEFGVDILIDSDGAIEKLEKSEA